MEIYLFFNWFMPFVGLLSLKSGQVSWVETLLGSLKSEGWQLRQGFLGTVLRPSPSSSNLSLCS